MALNVLYANNAQGTLASPITSAATSITLSPGQGALFPSPTGTDYFRATLYDAATGLINEITHVTAVVGDTLTVVRGQEGTTAKSYLAGDILANLQTAADAQLVQQYFATQTVSVAGGVNVTLTAIQAQAQTLIFTGALTANIQVIFPQQSRQYTLVNSTSGAFTLTAIQATGTGSLLPQNGIPYKVYSDSVNMNFMSEAQKYADDTGIVNAYVITLNPIPTALIDGFTVAFSTVNSNTTNNPTLNVNGTGAVTMTDNGGASLDIGQVKANTVQTWSYNSTGPRWELQSSIGYSQLESVSASVATNALTVGLQSTVLEFRNSSLTSGSSTLINIPTALSLTVPSGATLGTTNAILARLMLLAINNAGTAELAIVNQSGGVNLDETTLISTTAISGTSNANNVIYSTTARTSVPFRVVGYIEITEATAGTWASAPTLVQGVGGQAAVGQQTLGMGQTWQNVLVTPGRAVTTTYYNTTGRPISVSVVMNTAASSTTSLVISGITVQSINDGVAGGLLTLVGIVPPGASYSIQNTAGAQTIFAWSELR